MVSLSFKFNIDKNFAVSYNLNGKKSFDKK